MFLPGPPKMPPKKSAESLRKVLARKRKRLENVLLEVQEIKQSGKTPNISQSTLGHQAKMTENGQMEMAYIMNEGLIYLLYLISLISNSLV